VDPNITLKDIEAILNKLENNEVSQFDSPMVLDELAYLIGTLNNWLTNGGFLPTQWSK
jgi:hypothetical protein